MKLTIDASLSNDMLAELQKKWSALKQRIEKREAVEAVEAAELLNKELNGPAKKKQKKASPKPKPGDDADPFGELLSVQPAEASVAMFGGHCHVWALVFSMWRWNRAKKDVTPWVKVVLAIVCCVNGSKDHTQQGLDKCASILNADQALQKRSKTETLTGTDQAA